MNLCKKLILVLIVGMSFSGDFCLEAASSDSHGHKRKPDSDHPAASPVAPFPAEATSLPLLPTPASMPPSTYSSSSSSSSGATSSLLLPVIVTAEASGSSDDGNNWKQQKVGETEGETKEEKKEVKESEGEGKEAKREEKEREVKDKKETKEERELREELERSARTHLDLNNLKERHKTLAEQGLPRREVIEKLSDQVSDVVDGSSDRVNGLLGMTEVVRYPEIFIALIRAYVLDNSQDAILIVIETYPEHVQRALRKEFYYHTKRWLDKPLELSISKMIWDGVLPLPNGIDISYYPPSTPEPGRYSHIPELAGYLSMSKLESYSAAVAAIESAKSHVSGGVVAVGTFESKGESTEEKGEEKRGSTSSSSSSSTMIPETSEFFQLVEIYARHPDVEKILSILPKNHLLYIGIIKKVAQKKCKLPGFIDWFVALPEGTGPGSLRTKVLEVINQEAEAIVARIPVDDKEFKEFKGLRDGVLKMKVRQYYRKKTGQLIDACDISKFIEMGVIGAGCSSDINLSETRLAEIIETLIVFKSEHTQVLPSSSLLFLYKKLRFPHSFLMGEIPTSISRLTCESIDLDFNNLTGEIPETLWGMLSLKHLDLSHNNLTGVVPESISRLSNLRVLNLSYNNLTGVIPEGMSRLSALQNLDLSNNNFTGELPASIINLIRLAFVDLRNTPLLIKPPALIAALRARGVMVHLD